MKSVLGNTRRSDITFHKSGRIDISSRVAKLLGLSRGDVIDVSEHEGEYYLYVKFHAPVIGRYEAVCYPSSKKGNHFRVWSSNLCRIMMSLAGVQADRIELPTGAPTSISFIDNAIPIITKNILNQDDTRDQI